MSTRVDAHALKHGLSEYEVRYAWESLVACRQRNGEDEPPIWVGVGILPDGRTAELVALEDRYGNWVVFHAMRPPTKKVLKELGMNGRRRQV